MKRKMLHFLLMLILIVVYDKAQAQNDLYEMSLDELLNLTVVTASQQEQKLDEAPATIRVITDEEIEKFGWRDLKDVFKAIPGVDVSYDVQGEIKTLVTMRGVLGNQKLLILQDGQRMNPITGERFIFGHNIPLYLFKRIEIVYGPASALYGADAYAGVINLISKDGADIDGIQVSQGYNTTDAYIGNITFGKKISDEADVIISARYYNGEDFKLHEEYDSPIDYGAVKQYEGILGEQPNTYPIKNWNLFTKLKYKKFRIGMDWQHEYETNAFTEIPINYAYIDEDVWGQDLRHAYIEHTTINTDKFSLTPSVSIGDYEVNPASNFTIPIDVDTNEILDNYFNGYKYAYSGYVEGKVQANYKLTDKSTLIAGVSYTSVKSFPKTQNLNGAPFAKNKGLQDDLTMYVDSNGYVFGLLGLTDSIFGERNYYNVGSFVQSQIALIESLTLTLGARYDYNSIYESTINPRAGLVFKPIKSLSVKGLFGTAYIQPSNYYRWENWANPYAMHIPNENIKPEKLQSYELSISYSISPKLSLRTSLFRNEMTDIIKPIGASAQENNYPYYNPLSVNPSVTYVEINDNFGEVYSQGLEFVVNGQIDNVIANVSYSYIEGENTELDVKTDLEKISTHKIVGNISYFYKNFFTGFTARYYSDISTAASNSYYGLTKGTIPGSFILYGNIGYRFFKVLKFNVSGENIFNTKHYGAAPYGESIWIQPRAPQALRKLYFGLTYNF